MVLLFIVCNWGKKSPNWVKRLFKSILFWIGNGAEIRPRRERRKSSEIYDVTGVSTFCYLQNRKKWLKRTSFNVFVAAQKKKTLLGENL